MGTALPSRDPSPKSTSNRPRLRLVMPTETQPTDPVGSDANRANLQTVVGDVLVPRMALRTVEIARLKPTEELLAELAEASRRLEDSSPEEIIEWAAERFLPYLGMATAFGPEGCVILSMIAGIAPQTYLFNLETGYQFQQTLDLRDRLMERYGIEVELLQPELTVPEYEAVHGGPLYKTNPTQCCFDRKVKVLERAAQGLHAWMSGIRRDQSGDRAKAAIVGWDKKFQLVKISPLANWTKKDVWKRITDQDIPYNPLHDQGYASIGCWPCTRALADGESDERAGRWAGTGKTECGLHTVEIDGSGI